MVLLGYFLLFTFFLLIHDLDQAKFKYFLCGASKTYNYVLPYTDYFTCPFTLFFCGESE